MTIWRPRREDIPALVAIALLPVLLATPQLCGWLNADPVLATGGVASWFQGGFLPGSPYNDPNYGYTAHALGYRAALDWLAGEVPWWNPYSGVGLPLAAEYQPAAFSPFTLLLLLPRGMVLEHLALQFVAGWATYGLLRQLGLARLAAFAGGLLYAFDGTLALMGNGPAVQVPFLPLMLWGIERAQYDLADGVRRGWRLFAAGMALNLLGGFPETAYISGLLALAWSILRCMQTQRAQRLQFSARIALGGVTGILFAAPQVLAFFVSLPDSWIGMHEGGYGHGAMDAAALVPSLVAPFFFGPIYGYPTGWQVPVTVAAELGGYVTVVVLMLAVHGLIRCRSGLDWLLAAWCLLALGRTFGIEPATTLWNAVPGIPFTIFAKYAQPTWELALAILAARGLDRLAQQNAPPRAPLYGAVIALFMAIGVLIWFSLDLWPQLRETRALRNWALGSALWAVSTGIACLGAMSLGSARVRSAAIAALLAIDSMLMFAIPTLSNLRGGSVDLAAIGFLRDNLGLQRFYTLGPIQANYGAYFGIASINYNYMPVSRRWVEWVQQRLDRAADPTVFNGTYPRPGTEPTQSQELARNLAAYEAAAVKYVVAYSGADLRETTGLRGLREAYADGAIRIFELPEPRPYFEAMTGRCVVKAADRTRVALDCAEPARLVRRELFFPGWTAAIDGDAVAIEAHEELFQSILVPAGRSEVRYRYAPPYANWAWLMALFGAVLLALPAMKRRR